MSRQPMCRALVVCVAGLFCASVAAAQSKVAIINLQKAVTETAEIKKAQADMQAKYKSRQDAFEKTQREFQDLQTQLQNSAGKLSQQGQMELEIRAKRKQTDAQRMGEDLQADVDRDRNEILGGAGQKLQGIVKKLAEDKGLDLVVDVSNAVYFKPAIDITTEAIAAYDKAYPVKK
jgi:outer membrane protein